MNALMSTARQLKIAPSIARQILAAVLMCFVCLSANSEPYQRPLFLGGGGVPGNLVLVPSVEYPTINSVANLKLYDKSKEYTGYFDSNKCYNYQGSATESERHFYPVGTTTTHACSGQWSGNFLNWAATQTIDPFRKVLTGGYRVKDTPTETWLEKAYHDGQQSNLYPDRRLPDSGNNSIMVSGATPFTTVKSGTNNVTVNYIGTKIHGLGNKMYFRFNSTTFDQTTVVTYPQSELRTDRIYEVTIRVKVCDPSVKLETSCVKYSQGWKPEGLIQQYNKEIRYSVFGYLNDSNPLRDGGVLRARQKFVGPVIPGKVETDNSYKEWNPLTGVLIVNPNPDDATSSNVPNSGVINYLNKFGQTKINGAVPNHKSYDPVSELFYSSVRYVKNQGNVPAYSSNPTETMKDGFPVITNWDDPIQDWCQPNVFLGIGDVYTHRDKNLPGGLGGTDEPAKPSQVSGDSTVNVATATNKVAQLQGITINTPFTGRQNSAYIAGLAYDSHTKDMRPDLPGKQTASTYWVDVLEAQSLEPIKRNQYWLAAKYGGFKVPEDFDPYTRTTALPEEWWHTNSEMLKSFGSRGDGSTFPRADNYFVAGEAGAMVKSLELAFAKIVSELSSGSASAVATDSARIKGGTKIFQAMLDSSDWSGQLVAYEAKPDGSLGLRAWDTDDPDPPKFKPVGERPVFTIKSGSGIDFKWSNLSTEQQGALRGTDDEQMGEYRLNWLRGDDSQEGAPLRSRNKILSDGTTRRRLLGDIINSNPLTFPSDDPAPAPSNSAGLDSYSAFSTAQASDSKTLYVGANDGMFHAFNADTGIEQFAYIPNAVFPKLASLTDPNYTHQYYVDGSPTASYAYIHGSWRSVLVGTLGAGGRAVFGLDITNPDTPTKDIVLWEYTDADLGYMVGQMSPTPVIGCLSSGSSCRWVAVFGNGYQSKVDLKVANDPNSGTVDNSQAYLYAVDLEDPTSKLIKIAAGAEKANGLSAPVLILDNQRSIIGAYAGDLRGNLWKFDLINKTSTLLFTTPRSQADTVDQPITAAPEVALHPVSGYMVYFGTGQYFEATDHTSDIPVQSLYGIWDNGTKISFNQLLQQSIIGGTIMIEEEGNNWRLVSQNPICWEVGGDCTTVHGGWYVNLVAAGERVTDAPILSLGRAIFGTQVPNDSDDPCESSTGESWLMAVDMETGGRVSTTVFDVNRDLQFDESDNITVTVNGQEISGVASGFGVISAGMSQISLRLSDRGIDAIASGLGGLTTSASSVSVARLAAIAYNKALAAAKAAAEQAAQQARDGGADESTVAQVTASAVQTAATNVIASATTAAAVSGVSSTVSAEVTSAIPVLNQFLQGVVDINAARQAVNTVVQAATGAGGGSANTAAAAAIQAALAAIQAVLAAQDTLTQGGDADAIIAAISGASTITVEGGKDDVGVAISYQIGRGSWRQLQ